MARKKFSTKGKFSLVELIRSNRSTVKAFLIFATSITVSFFILITHILDRYFIYPFTVSVAKTAGVALKLLGMKTSVYGTILRTPEASLNIGTGCNGIEAVVIFISAILAFPTGWKNKMWGLLWGFAGIFIINQSRVIGLFLINLHAPQYLDLAHTYIGQTYVIIAGLALWILWAERISHARQKVPAPAA
ncbi:MAG: archaeosortase/exosortase family protein [candidate division Zixibacteria bacterium]|nr:archaeosortase/exosortase family protein [candidate division Zixibacteria bacterium]